MAYKPTDEILEDCYVERVGLAYTQLCNAIEDGGAEETGAADRFKDGVELAERAREIATAVFAKIGRK
jgi:hypothetical protein